MLATEIIDDGIHADEYAGKQFGYRILGAPNNKELGR
jgi:hypothetical protein